MKLIIADDKEASSLTASNEELNIFDLPENLEQDDIISIVSSKNFKVAKYFANMGILHDSLRSNDFESIAGKIVTILGFSVNFISYHGKVIASVNAEEGMKNRFSKNQYIPGMDKIKNFSPDTVFFNPKHSNKLLPVDEFEDKITKLISNCYSTKDVAYYDMKAWHLGVITLHCFIAHASKKTASFYLYINGGGNHQFHTTKAGANVNFLVFINISIAQVQTDASESGYQTSPME